MSLIAGYLLLVGLLGLAHHTSRGPALSHSAGRLLVVCAMEVLVFGVIFGLACLASRPSLDDLRMRWRGNVLPVLWGILYSVGLRVGVGMAVAAVAMVMVLAHATTLDGLQHFMLSNQPDVKVLVDISALKNDPVYFWLTLTVVSFVVAGLREELWRSAFLAGMKGVWPQYFGSRGGQIAAVFVGAVIFGSAHLPMGILAAGMAGLLGVGLGLIMVCHRSIWPAVIAHGLFDATTFAILPWASQFMK